MKPADGIASVALGLGHTVMEGGRALKFSPKYPQHPVQFSAWRTCSRNSQKNVLRAGAPRSGRRVATTRETIKLLTLDIADAEADGTLAALASTYSHENHQVYDGMGRVGASSRELRSGSQARLVSARPRSSGSCSGVGTRGMSSSVEIEFAARTCPSPAASPAISAFCRCVPW